jgi:hypothetical protein
VEAAQEMMSRTSGAISRRETSASQVSLSGSLPEYQGIRKYLYQAEKLAFACEDEKVDTSVRDQKTVELLKDLHTSSHAFIVFETEVIRNEALNETRKQGGVKFEWEEDGALKETMLTLQKKPYEPQTVQWEHFHEGNTTTRKIMKTFQGALMILGGLAIWTLVFYAPYAWSVYNFNYDNGQEPPFVYGFAFSMVVVIGNAIMYAICDVASSNIGFLFQDQKEACYMVSYTVACSLNIIADMLTTYIIAWKITVGLGFRTYEGQPIESVDRFTTRFETYAMQRLLAENAYLYAWPSTYLIPFLIEPIITVWVPFELGRLILKSHPEILGSAAENMLCSAPMELGRYSDLLLNVILGILIFYFPGGYTCQLFLFMVMAHIYIYCYDHYKVLRIIPQIEFSTMVVDWWAQVMLAPCCGMILSCLVFKASGQGYFGIYIDGAALIITCSAAFALHCLVHILVLIYVVPRFGKKDDDVVSAKSQNKHMEVSWRDVCETRACSWFTANPVHGLRSRFVYQHQPPCGYFIPGKEHCLDRNEEIGCHFSTFQAPPETERAIGDLRKTLTIGFQEAKSGAGSLMVKSGISTDSLLVRQRSPSKSDSTPV